MERSFWRRYLPWTLVLAMIVTGLGFYARSPVWEFEVDLRDEKVAESPASELYQRIAKKIHDPAWKEKPERINVLFRSEMGWQREVFLMANGPGDPVTAAVSRAGVYIDEDRTESMRQIRQRLHEFAEAADAVQTPAIVLLSPPDCSLREWSEFLRLGQNRILWAVHLP